MTNLLGCTGGWCSSREKCAHYLQGQANDDIRLCGETEEPMVVKEVEVKDGMEENQHSHPKIRKLVNSKV